MTLRTRWTGLILGFGLLSACPFVALGGEEHAFFHENVLGTSMELRVLADTPESARIAEAAALGEIDRLARIFSQYDAASEFRRWQESPPGPFPVSRELFELLASAERWRVLSGGAFDPRVEVLSGLWSASAREDREPTTTELDRARSRMVGPAWRAATGPRSLERLSDCPLSLNAIAKGYIVEHACEAARRADPRIRGLLLNIGGDLRVSGDMTRTLGIASPWSDSESSEPFEAIEVRDRAVATSGASQRGFRIKGEWYSHIIDPRSGRPVSGVASATVIAASSTDADVLATVANILPPEETLELVKSLRGAECLIVTHDGRIERSPGWGNFLAAGRRLDAESHLIPATREDADDSKEASWSRDSELVVSFEINSPEGEGRRYRRPYVAVWVEDEEGKPIRTLTLWVSMGGAGPFQWIPDLKRWYKADQLRKQTDKRELVFTMSRPTRPPGKYRVVWDGKDDQGKPVPAGKYTVFIDAAREHGTYQNLRREVTVGGEPFRHELPGDVEIKAASIEYRRKNARGAATKGNAR